MAPRCAVCGGPDADGNGCEFCPAVTPFVEPSDEEKLGTARLLFRRGYSWIDACGNAGLSSDDYLYDAHVRPSDETGHDSAINRGWEA